MGKKKSAYNVLINDLDIDENLLTDDETKARPIKEANNLRSRPGKKKKKLNKVISDENLINISDIDSSSSTEPSDLLDDQAKMDNENDENLKFKNNEYNFLDNYLNERDNSETDEFKNNLDLNLKKKKRIFLSNDRTDLLNFVLSEQQKIKKSSEFNSLLPYSTSTFKQTKQNNFKLTPLNRPLNSNYSDDDYEDEANSEFNLLLKDKEPNSIDDLNSEFADDEDDGLNYLDYLNSRSTNRRFRRLYTYFLSFFHTRTHVNSNLNRFNLLNKPTTAANTLTKTITTSQSNLSENDLDDLYFDRNFLNKNSSSFLNKFRTSFSNFSNYFLHSNSTHLNNLNINYHQKFKNQNINQTAERLNLTKANSNDTNLSSDDFREDDDGWYDGSKEINVRLLKTSKHKPEQESRLFIAVQVFIPFLIAGFGTVGAGLVLDLVQHWKVFQNISEVFILVPALLGLKGNLEMTLASRLSTQANLGNLNTFRKQWKMATGNLALIQCQATVVGFLAALFAIAVNWLPNAEFNLKHAFLLCASSLLTASIASFVLGVVMIVVVVVSHKCNINPDNVATPIAASLGDLTTLLILSNLSNYLYFTIDDSIWICVLCIVTMLVLVPIWCTIAYRNENTRQVLYNGWTPVVTAMAISSFGGCILDFAVSRFKGIAVFQPVINGVGGNLVAVQASRMSTFLHQKHRLGVLDTKEKDLCISPFKTFFGNNVHARTAIVLLILAFPGHLIFIQGIRLLQAGHTSITMMFLAVYLSAALIQVFILLYLAQIIIFWMWKRKIDPDNSAIPYLTALGDLIGTGLLSVAFYTLYHLSDYDEDVGE